MGSAVITHPIIGRIVDHCAVIDSRDIGDPDVVYRAVVVKVVFTPVSALIAPSDIVAEWGFFRGSRYVCRSLTSLPVPLRIVGLSRIFKGDFF